MQSTCHALWIDSSAARPRAERNACVLSSRAKRCLLYRSRVSCARPASRVTSTRCGCALPAPTPEPTHTHFGRAPPPRAADSVAANFATKGPYCGDLPQLAAGSPGKGGGPEGLGPRRTASRPSAATYINHTGVKHINNSLYPEKLLLDSCIRLGESFPANYNCPMRFWFLHSVTAL